jgi:hypothetical protein
LSWKKEIPMRRVIVAGVLLVLGGLCGCGSGPDGVVKAQIKTTNDLANALESNAPEADVQEIQKRLDHLRGQLSGLKLSETEEKKLMEKYQPEMEAATQRLMTATMTAAMRNLGGTAVPGLDGKNPFGGTNAAGGR